MTGCEKKTQEAPILAQADLVIYAVQEPSVYEPVIKEFEERTKLVVDVCVGTTEELKQMLEHDRIERENREVGKHRNDGSVQSVCKEQTDNQIQESYQEQQKTLDWDLVFWRRGRNPGQFQTVLPVKICRRSPSSRSLPVQTRPGPVFRRCHW